MLEEGGGGNHDRALTVFRLQYYFSTTLWHMYIPTHTHPAYIHNHTYIHAYTSLTYDVCIHTLAGVCIISMYMRVHEHCSACLVVYLLVGLVNVYARKKQGPEKCSAAAPYIWT